MGKNLLLLEVLLVGSWYGKRLAPHEIRNSVRMSWEKLWALLYRKINDYMKLLTMLHIMYCKMQSIFYKYKCINDILIALKYKCTLYWLIICPDWNISIMVNVEISISYLGAMLSGCVSPHSPDTLSKYTALVNTVIYCTYASYCWYKCRCAIYNTSVSPCWYSKPYICPIDTLCSHRSVSPCIHGVKCIYNFHNNGILCS